MRARPASALRWSRFAHRRHVVLAILLLGAFGAQPVFSEERRVRIGFQPPQLPEQTEPAEGEQEPSTGAKPARDLTRPEPIEGPVDRAEYLLGPGDRIAVTLRGNVQRTEQLFVTAEGTVILPPTAGVKIAGLTIEAAEDTLRSAMKPYFHDVELHLDLVDVRRFQVYVLGAVLRPGMYEASGTMRVGSVLDEAGGILPIASSREIRVEHRDGSKSNADILKFNILGDRDANPTLSDGDRVVVPIAGEKATVHGFVGQGGEFEALPGETISDLILLAGGTTPGADRARVEVRRFVSASDPATLSVGIDLDGETAETPVEPGDQIRVYGIPDWHTRRVVDVRGQVSYPGGYVIDEGRETLTGVIRRAGGLTPEASVHEMTLTRTIGKEVIDPEFERLKKIEVGDMTRNEYEYFKLKSREFRGRVVVDFEALMKEGKIAEDVPLRRGDIIDVPIATLSIKVSGQVAAPGAIAYDPEKPVKWYIERAGGYGWRAQSGKTRVIRARTGEWIPAKKAKSLEAGDTIWVPEKPERDYWEIFKEGLVLTGQLLTIYLVIDNLANK